MRRVEEAARVAAEGGWVTGRLLCGVCRYCLCGFESQVGVCGAGGRAADDDDDDDDKNNDVELEDPTSREEGSEGGWA